jgi:hypothetical protein
VCFGSSSRCNGFTVSLVSGCAAAKENADKRHVLPFKQIELAWAIHGLGQRLIKKNSARGPNSPIKYVIHKGTKSLQILLSNLEGSVF